MLYSLLKPLLFRLDAERAHNLVSGLLRISEKIAPARAVMSSLYAYDDPSLMVECAGLRFSNPVGLAAGFDKRGVLVAATAPLGFGHIEIGTVTPRPQPGNNKPRMFRLPEDEALINRLGFNSPGMVEVARHLRYYISGIGCQGEPPRHLIPNTRHPVVGVNIGKNRATPLERAVEDYTAAFVALAPLAGYVAINISSPNTPGLRKLHDHHELTELLGALAMLNRRLPAPRPLFLKVSPDETPARLDQVASVAIDTGIAGIIAGNTTLARDGLRGAARAEAGGLSGRPLTTRARRAIAHLYATTEGKMPIIGVGGVMSAADAYGHIRAGATMVQVYSGMIYHGPGLAREIKRGLAALLRRDGYATLAEAIGS